MPLSNGLKIFNIIGVVMFLSSAALQYNDPDPWVWGAIYLVGALLCALALRGKIYPPLYWIVGLLYASYAVWLFFSQDGVLNWLLQHQAENIAQSMKAEKPWIEATREFFGLMILLTTMLVNYRALYK
jgi:hypothetical protein